jgi:hypothetical protein
MGSDMKLHHAAALGLLLLASCGPTIEKSTTRAESAADRAEMSATQAQQAADQAFNMSVRALVAAHQAEKDLQRANDSVARMEIGHPVPQCDLLVKPKAGLTVGWCLMGPPILGGNDSQSIDWFAPRSRYCVSEIFDTKRDCHESLGGVRRSFLKDMRDYRRLHPHEKYVPFRLFCAACANDGEDYED